MLKFVPGSAAVECLRRQKHALALTCGAFDARGAAFLLLQMILVWLIVAGTIGALAFEMAGGRKLKESSRAGVGATLGLLAGALGKVFCCLAMMGLFTADVIYRSLG